MHIFGHHFHLRHQYKAAYLALLAFHFSYLKVHHNIFLHISKYKDVIKNVLDHLQNSFFHQNCHAFQEIAPLDVHQIHLL